MVQGLPSLVSGMQAQWYRHEVLANNLANVSTSGFKRDDLMLAPSVPAGASLADLGGNASLVGAQLLVQWTDFSQGQIHETGRNLDVALNGPGFFVVETPNGQRYSRAGAFKVSGEGFLVASDGSRMLGQRGPIALRSAQVSITEQGEIQEEGQTVDTIRVVDFPKPYPLLKEGNGLFVSAPGVVPLPARGHQLLSGSLESSNVNPVETMVGMIEVLRNYEAYQRAIQAVDEANRHAINEMGRV